MVRLCEGPFVAIGRLIKRREINRFEAVHDLLLRRNMIISVAYQNSVALEK